MKNFKYSEKRITLALASDVASGTLSRVLGFIGMPLVNGLAGQSIAIALEGVFGMTYAAYPSLQPAAGSILYWDTTGAVLSVGAANDDYAAVKCVTAVSSSDGSFDGLLLPQDKPYGQEQS